jgi:hypothetical protein
MCPTMKPLCRRGRLEMPSFVKNGQLILSCHFVNRNTDVPYVGTRRHQPDARPIHSDFRQSRQGLS